MTGQIIDSGGAALPVPSDLADAESIAHHVDTILPAFGRLDVAVNNGVDNHPRCRSSRLVRPTSTGPGQPDRHLSPVQHQIRAIAANGCGAFVNDASQQACEAAPGMSAYASAHAVIGLTPRGRRDPPAEAGNAERADKKPL